MTRFVVILKFLSSLPISLSALCRICSSASVKRLSGRYIQPLQALLFHALTAAPLALYAAVVGWQEQFTFEHVMYSFPSDNRSRRGISPQNGHGLNSILAIAFSSFLHGLLAPSDYTEEVGVAPLQVLIADAVRCIAGRHRVPAALHDTRTLVDALSA